MDEDGRCRDVHARVDAHVDLPVAHVKGIHMSRLYALVGGLSDGEPLSSKRLSTLLDAMIDSHRHCGSRSARVRAYHLRSADLPPSTDDGGAVWMEVLSCVRHGDEGWAPVHGRDPGGGGLCLDLPVLGGAVTAAG